LKERQTPHRHTNQYTKAVGAKKLVREEGLGGEPNTVKPLEESVMRTEQMMLAGR